MYQHAGHHQASNRSFLCTSGVSYVCLSTLQLYLQFYDVTDEVRDLENRAIKLMLAGPHAWTVKEDVFVLNSHLKCPADVPSIEVISVVCRLRVLAHEEALIGNRAQELGNAPTPHFRLVWTRWFK